MPGVEDLQVARGDVYEPRPRGDTSHCAELESCDGVYKREAGARG